MTRNPINLRKAQLKLVIQHKQKSTIRLRTKILAFSFFAIIAGSIVFLLNSETKVVLAASGNDSGRCLTFNGTSTSVDFGSTNFNLSSSNTMSIGAWVKWGSKTGIASWANIVTLNNSTGSGDVGQFWLQHDWSNNYFEFAVQTTNSRKQVIGNVVCVPGNWYYVAGVYDGSAIKLYVNGKLQNSASQNGNISSFISTYKFMIGKWANTGRYFNGEIDEVSLWNKALTQTQIRSIMCQKLAGTESGLIGYWRMNEASGSTVNDYTTNNHNGTIVGATRIISSAPVGDTAVYVYAGSQLTFINSRGDSLKVSNFNSTPSSIFIYCVDTVPNSTSLSSDVSTIGNSYFYGIFFPDYNNETYTLTYYYKGYPGIMDKSLLGLSYRASNSDMLWLNLTASLDTLNNALSKTSMSGNHEFILNSKFLINPLPVKLISFNAEVKEQTVTLTWKTASEINNDYFTIERSYDGENFENLQYIRGAGNSTIMKVYTATDSEPKFGTIYYRLKQTDYDGKFEVFNIISINIKGAETDAITIENVFPNPFKDNFDLVFRADKKLDLTLNMYNNNGIPVYTKFLQAEAGQNQMKINMNTSLADGYYTLILTDQANHQKKVKLMKLETAQ